MENLINIINTKASDIEFDLNIQGLSEAPDMVRLSIETNEMNISFRCEKMADMEHKWVAKIPALPHIERGAFPYNIEVVIDGYYFQPTRGTANITIGHEIYTSAPQGPVLTGTQAVPTVPTAPVVKTDVPKKPLMPKQRPVHEIMKNITGQLAEGLNVDAPTKKEVKKPIVKKTKMPKFKDSVNLKEAGVDTTKEDNIKKVLEGMGVKKPAKIDSGIAFLKGEKVKR